METKIDENTSDGYHTFKELYEHRHALYILVANADQRAWKSVRHADGSEWDGWFISGIDFEHGPITYHLPARLWKNLKCKELNNAPEWDGHTSEDVVKRLHIASERV